MSPKGHPTPQQIILPCHWVPRCRTALPCQPQMELQMNSLTAHLRAHVAIQGHAYALEMSPCWYDMHSGFLLLVLGEDGFAGVLKFPLLYFKCAPSILFYTYSGGHGAAFDYQMQGILFARLKFSLLQFNEKSSKSTYVIEKYI